MTTKTTTVKKPRVMKADNPWHADRIKDPYDMEAMLANNHKLICFAREADSDLIAFYYERRHEDLFIVIGLAQNPNCPAELLSEFARHEDDRVRRSVATNPNADADTLRYLADEEAQAAFEQTYNTSDPAFLCWLVAKNPSVPDDLVTRFARHSSESVRYAIAGRDTTPVELLLRLIARERKAMVRNAARAQEGRITAWLIANHPELADLDLTEAARTFTAAQKKQ